jgi:hypothetical protein
MWLGALKARLHNSLWQRHRILDGVVSAGCKPASTFAPNATPPSRHRHRHLTSIALRWAYSPQRQGETDTYGVAIGYYEAAPSALQGTLRFKGALSYFHATFSATRHPPFQGHSRIFTLPERYWVETPCYRHPVPTGRNAAMFRTCRFIFRSAHLKNICAYLRYLRSKIGESDGAFVGPPPAPSPPASPKKIPCKPDTTSYASVRYFNRAHPRIRTHQLT